MKGRILTLLSTVFLFTLAGSPVGFSARGRPQEGVDVTTPEAGGEHLRIETAHGPLNLWRPSNYNARTAGIVIYIHGYFTSVDQAWADDQLAAQFHDSGRNALFIAIEAPHSNDQDVFWKSLANLLRTVEDRAPYSLPRGPLVVIGHSGGFRTILLWRGDQRLQYLILLDGLYAGQAEFRSWLRPRPRANPHRMVLVSSDTWQQSLQFARHISGAARRTKIPADASSFTPRETHARLLCLRSQYEHHEIISSGKVIPMLLQISPLSALAAPKLRPAKRAVRKPPALSP
jgi:hypothetical protein